ncbi:uncharacterized protein BJ171DRAFT_580068 [Polychytrium aggregatum]|uniref:uncharacterized protein n=1 Tax=Polychytrium aggregatum TaxID=110093 RepID=UPI0022FEFB2D|nr:uncharacterized protein BJ171DRAFT_580068 [Polychytrium aggregatum]KAI9205994.1 hypothetical protein BJ171DRAFT_580068 [Polychytrium aggregatum]
MILSIDAGLRNLALCTLHPTTRKIFSWRKLDVCSGRTWDPVGVCSNLKHLLDLELADTPPLTHIVLESQPASNNKTCAINHFLMSYFVHRYGAHSKEPQLVITAARSKFKDLGVPKEDLVTYSQRKACAVQQALKALEETQEDEKWLWSFQNTAKKDDLADAYLQALCALYSMTGAHSNEQYKQALQSIASTLGPYKSWTSHVKDGVQANAQMQRSQHQPSHPYRTHDKVFKYYFPPGALHAQKHNSQRHSQIQQGQQQYNDTHAVQQKQFPSGHYSQSNKKRDTRDFDH